MNPTQRQVEALRKFRVPEEQIRALSIGQASEMLAQLVQRARSGKATPPTVILLQNLQELNALYRPNFGNATCLTPSQGGFSMPVIWA